jgi:hypothetical protein
MASTEGVPQQMQQMQEFLAEWERCNPEHLSLVLQGSLGWNEWRRCNPDIKVDLANADLHLANLAEVNLRSANLRSVNLSGAYLPDADLSHADLRGANLRWAHLSGAHLSGANLRGASLGGANLGWADLNGTNLNGENLSGANLHGANLSGTDLGRAFLVGTNLSRANLSGTNMNGTTLQETVFCNVDLSKTMGLDNCVHRGPSSIDFKTLTLAANLPISFLRGCGLPNILIDYLPSFHGDAIQFYSCFISYSSKDQLFADRLHADLQTAGVRCWFAPHDLPIGAKTWDAIDKAITVQDKLLVILSEASIGSDWVEDEVDKAYAEERDRKTIVLFPVRIDDVVMRTPKPWARKLRDQRNIGDFRQWESPAVYSQRLARLLRDLKGAESDSRVVRNL